MAISKQYLKTKPACKVTFVVPAEQAASAESVVLVGEFNDWRNDEQADDYVPSPVSYEQNSLLRL